MSRTFFIDDQYADTCSSDIPARMHFPTAETYRTNVNRFVQFAVNVFDVHPDYQDMEGTALKGIEAWEDWCRKIKMPTSLSELGLDPTDEQMWEMANKATSNDTVKIGGFVPLNARMVYEILNMAR